MKKWDYDIKKLENSPESPESYLNRKFGSKEMLQFLSAFGFGASYDDVLLLEASVVIDEQDFQYGNSSVQTVGDNADHDTRTLSGHDTFHVMGRIEIITPKNTNRTSKPIPRLNKLPTADILGSVGKVNLQYLDKPSYLAMEKIRITNIELRKKVTANIVISPTEFWWLYGKHVQPLNLKGWHGFMETITKDLKYDMSQIRILPFIDNPASNYDTGYTTLLEADRKCKALGQKDCFVTFDQPLYAKAREILVYQGHELTSVNIRLGGFHLLMSYMGSIGFIMVGSELAELFCQIYAPNSVPIMLKGHAYSRAVRAHTL